MKNVENARKEYEKLKNELQREFDENSPLYFAFGLNKAEVITRLKEQGANTDDIIGLGAGAYIEKKDLARYNELTENIAERLKVFLNKSLTNIGGAYLYWLWNLEARLDFGSDGYDEALHQVFNEAGVTVRDFDRDEIKKLLEIETYYNKKFDEVF